MKAEQEKLNKDGGQLSGIIMENTRSLKELYNSGQVSKQDMIDQLKVAEDEEEFEVAISIRNVLNSI